jgi:hypothetical protein
LGADLATTPRAYPPPSKGTRNTEPSEYGSFFIGHHAAAGARADMTMLTDTARKRIPLSALSSPLKRRISLSDNRGASNHTLDFAPCASFAFDNEGDSYSLHRPNGLTVSEMTYVQWATPRHGFAGNSVDRRQAARCLKLASVQLPIVADYGAKRYDCTFRVARQSTNNEAHVHYSSSYGCFTLNLEVLRLRVDRRNGCTSGIACRFKSRAPHHERACQIIDGQKTAAFRYFTFVRLATFIDGQAKA